MKAIVLLEYGGVEKLELRDVPAPEPAADEIQVRVAAASLNPVDWKLRRGDLKMAMPLTLPAILGRDASGVVTKVGPGVTAFAVGDRVLGLVQGAYAEHVVARVDAWAKMPEGLDLVDAAALPLVVLTGTQLMEEAVAPSPGQVVLVTGALGGVGRSAVYAAKKRGVKVWAGVRGRQRSEAQSLEADGVVALDDPTDVAKLPQLDAIADTVGGAALTPLLPKVKAGGTVGSVVGESAEAKQRGLQVRALFAHPDARRLAELAAAVARGELRIPIARKLPLADAREAQAFAEKGAAGKVLLIP